MGQDYIFLKIHEAVEQCRNEKRVGMELRRLRTPLPVAKDVLKKCESAVHFDE